MADLFLGVDSCMLHAADLYRVLWPHRDEHRLKVRASVETALGVFLNDTLPEDSAQRLAAVAVDDGSWDGVAVPLIKRASAVDRVVQS